MNKEFRENLKKLGISIVYLFGSRIVGKRTPLSDVDIGVIFKDATQCREKGSLYTRLFELFSDSYPATKIDIVFLQTAPLSLQYSAVKEGKILFEENPVFTADYEYSIMNQYVDFRPVLDFFDQTLAERYGET